MKRIVLISTLVVTVLLNSMSAFASGSLINMDGSETTIQDMEPKKEISLEEVNIDEDTVNESIPSLFSSEIAPFKTRYYYGNLTNSEKKVYDAISDNIDSGNMDFTFRIDHEDYGNIDTSNNNLWKIGFSYIRFDYTDKFWIDSTVACGSGVDTDENGEPCPAFRYIYQNTINYTDSAKIDADRKAVAEVTEEILASIPKNATRKKQLQVLNDWLVDNNSYNYYVANGQVDTSDIKNKLPWIMTSALLYGEEENGKNNITHNENNPVCESYAEAFNYLCEQLGIPCTIVVSDVHEWNVVQMEDGNWYNVDVTHNDPIFKFPENVSQETIDYNVNRYRYSHFLLGSDNEAMQDSDHNMVVEYNCVPPTVSTSDYVYAHTGDADMDLILEQEDAALILKHLSGIATLTDEQIASADINNDGELTIADATLLLTKISK